MAECKTCGGTGKIVCLNSHFITDRTHKERCYICLGSGESSFQPDPHYARFQRNARASFPRHPEIAEQKDATK